MIDDNGTETAAGILAFDMCSVMWSLMRDPCLLYKLLYLCICSMFNHLSALNGQLPVAPMVKYHMALDKVIYSPLTLVELSYI